jgi:pimeloyl-ACP methyl ester carboxylesterase/DNA-binding CsgD family transcriptional regulator
MARSGQKLLPSAAPRDYPHFMEQEIRFCTVEGRRLAYATVGEGPLLVLPTWWLSHLELDWQQPDVRTFVEQLAARHRVVRYDRLGAGLSDRDVDFASITHETEVRTLEALVDHLGEERCSLLALSCAGTLSARYAVLHPRRVRSLVFYNSFADGRKLASPELGAAMVGLTRADWRVGSRLLASLFLPRGASADISQRARYKRAAAGAEAAARFLELNFSADARDECRRLRVPTLVLQRQSDSAVDARLGRELAALIPGARFVPLAGRGHYPWDGDPREGLRAIASFLEGPAPSANGSSPLTSRETEVLQLVAAGLNNRQIASSLVVSEHTVHRHVANILRKLAQSSRAGAAAHAARVGLI